MAAQSFAGLVASVLLAAQPVIAESAFEAKLLPIDPIGQEQHLWCWAASAQMIATFLDPGRHESYRQCAQASERVLSVADCCGPEQVPDECVAGGWPFEDSEGFDFCSTEEGVALTWHELTEEIRQGRPVAFSWKNPDHMMVAIGYVDLSPARESPSLAQQWVVVNDPWPPDSGDQMLIPYEYYRDGNQGHFKDYWKIVIAGASDGSAARERCPGAEKP